MNSILYRMTIAAVLFTGFSSPSWAHPLDAKSMGQLKASTKNFAHARSAVVALNRPFPVFSTTTLDGKRLSNTGIKGKMTLFLLADTQCPCVQAVEGRVRRLYQQYGSKGLQVIYVFSNPGEKPIQVARFVRNHALPFTALLDHEQKMLKMLDGRCSSEVYLTDKAGRLRYHGRVDDSTFDLGSVRSQDLQNAVAALVQNKPVPRAFAPAMGCSIPRI